jgi:hypothetical protein
MKLTAKQVWQSQVAMEVLAQRTMQSRAAYEFSRAYKTIKAELVTISEQARPLIEKHGGVIDEAGRVKWPKDKEGKEDPKAQAEYGKEFDELLGAELDLPITPMRLSLVANMELQPAVFIDLEWLWVDDSMEPKK